MQAAKILILKVKDQGQMSTVLFELLYSVQLHQNLTSSFQVAGTFLMQKV